MEINISENELDYFTSTYRKAKKELSTIKENTEEKLLEQNDNELNHDYVDKEAKRFDKLSSDKLSEIYNSKKFHIESRSRRRGFKLFLVMLLSNYIAHFFPALVIPVAILSLSVFLVDVVFLSKKHLDKYARIYYESNEYKTLKSDLDYLKNQYERCMNELNEIEFAIMKCDSEIDSLNKRRRELEKEIDELKSGLFNKVVGLEEELEQPMELIRK